LLPRPPVNKFDLHKPLLYGLELPGMVSTIARRAIARLKRVAEKPASWFTVRYEMPPEPGCRIFTEDNFISTSLPLELALNCNMRFSLWK